MAIVLAIVILGWLIAFALGAQDGFETQTNTPTVPSSVTDSTGSEAASYKAPISAA